MTIQQYNDIKTMSYQEQLQYFKKTNGLVLYTYRSKNNKNQKPGYYIHHDAENFIGHLCRDSVRKKFSAKFQEPEYLTWVNLIQHGFLHLQIGRETKGKFGLEGLANFILPELEKYFEQGIKHPKKDAIYYEVIKDSEELYHILKSDYEVLAKELNFNPYYKAVEAKHNGKRRPARAVKCIETGVIYKNVKEAAAATGAHPTCIYQTIYKNAKSAGGYTWVFVNAITGEELPAMCHNVKIQQVLCIETNTVYTLAEAVEFAGCCTKHIMAHIRGKAPSAGGYTWKLLDPIPPKKFISGQKVRCVELDMCFNSMKEAGKYINRSLASISACLNGRAKTAGGYHWEKAY